MSIFDRINLSFFGFIIVTLVIVPVIVLLVLSFTGLDLTRPGSFEFIGFDNYINAFTDSRFIETIPTTLYLTFIPTFLQIFFGFLLALALYDVSLFREFFRSIFLVPMIIPPIVAGLIWKFMLTPRRGAVNYFLELMGIQGPDWLNSPISAIHSIVLTTVWEWTPFAILLILASLETIPEEILESAKVDGATYWQQVRHIMVPMIKSTLWLVVMFRTIEGFRVIFPLIFMMTRGGPGTTTFTMQFYTYRRGFDFLHVGYASSLATIIFAILLSLIWIPYLQRSRSSEAIG